MDRAAVTARTPLPPLPPLSLLLVVVLMPQLILGVQRDALEVKLECLEVLNDLHNAPSTRRRGTKRTCAQPWAHARTRTRTARRARRSTSRQEPLTRKTELHVASARRCPAHAVLLPQLRGARIRRCIRTFINHSACSATVSVRSPRQPHQLGIVLLVLGTCAFACGQSAFPCNSAAAAGCAAPSCATVGWAKS